jgi:glycosyltransferase involved in cell wall biosynthesis
MRIAQVLTASTGGIGRHVASIAPRLVARGHTVRVFCPVETASAHSLIQRGLDVRPLAELGRARGADVVHAHGYKAGGLCWPIARITGAPLAVSWHNAVLGEHRTASVARLLQRVVARCADLTLCASSDLVTEARRLGARRVQLLGVAAPALPTPSMSRALARASLGLAESAVLVLTVARLAPQKNLGLVLDVAAALDDGDDVRFVVVGEGPERSSLERRIAEQRLPVALLGHRDDLGSLLAAADLVLLTSAWEARSLVAQEALLAGLPLVSTRVGGIAELVGEAAVLIDPGDAQAAARAVAALADDPSERARLGELGRRQAATWPDEDQVVTDLLAAYQAVIQLRH